jgi:hypothetical protein
LNTEHFALETYGFVAAKAEFTFAAKEVGLHGDVFAGPPIFDRATNGANLSGDLSARRARERDLNGETAFFEPEVEMIQTAGLDLHDHFFRTGLRFG